MKIKFRQFIKRLLNGPEAESLHTCGYNVHPLKPLLNHSSSCTMALSLFLHKVDVILTGGIISVLSSSPLDPSLY